jgi:hypothetical protein
MVAQRPFLWFVFGVVTKIKPSGKAVALHGTPSPDISSFEIVKTIYTKSATRRFE